MINETEVEAKEGMAKTIAALEVTYQRIRTGRANPSLLDSIEVDYYGNPTPLKQVCNISVENAKTLSISPWEKDMVVPIEKAIQSSDLGLQPITSGEVIRVILPDLTEETRRELIKVAKSEAENSKVSIRNQRRDANGMLKEYLNEKEISEDDLKRGEELIQNATDEFIKKVDSLLIEKEKDLLDLNKEKGHKAGVKKARLAVEFFLENGIKELTLFAFSTENWGRQKKEVKALMKLFLEAINEQTPDLIKNKVKLNFIGEISRFDKVLIKQIKKSQENTSKYDSKMNLNIAISYGGRWDLEQALKKIIDDILKETIKIRNLNEDLISNYLSTSQIEDPDMIIRSGGEKRISNFFLWQAAYSEIYFSDKLWPDFNEKDFKKALNEFSSRKRKFGVETGI